MKKKKVIIICAILVILLVIIIIIFHFLLSKKNSSMNVGDFDIQKGEFGRSQEQGQEENREQEITLTQSSEVESAEVENVEVHAEYYLDEVYVEENQYVAKGENILRYTNGEYLVAPYDCCIAKLNLPEAEGECLNSHYVQIESTNILTVSMKVSEDYINNISVGDEATIEVGAIDGTYTGYVTHVGSIGSNGQFEINIEFENDGNTKIGMTSSVEINIL